MSIQVNSTLVNYNSLTKYTKTSGKTSENEDKQKPLSAKENEKNNIKSQMMDLKTSTSGVTRKEEIKTGFKNVSDYTQYLQNKYSFMNSGSTSMEGVPVTVNVSSAFLQKCKDNPEKAAYLEENLAAIPKCVKSTVNFTKGLIGNPEPIFLIITMDENGDITMMGCCSNDSKVAKENAERKAKEKKAKKKKAEKKTLEKKEAEKRAEKAKNGNNSVFNITVKGVDIKLVTQQLISKFSSGFSGSSELTSIDVMV